MILNDSILESYNASILKIEACMSVTKQNIKNISNAYRELNLLDFSLEIPDGLNLNEYLPAFNKYTFFDN